MEITYDGMWDDLWRTRTASERIKNSDNDCNDVNSVEQRKPLRRMSTNIQSIRDNTKQTLKNVKHRLNFKHANLLSCASGRRGIFDENYSPLTSPCRSPGHTPQRRASMRKHRTTVYEPFHIESPSKSPVLNLSLAKEPIRRSCKRTPLSGRCSVTPSKRRNLQRFNFTTSNDIIKCVEQALPTLEQMTASLNLSTYPQKTTTQAVENFAYSDSEVEKEKKESDAVLRRSTIVWGSQERLV